MRIMTVPIWKCFSFSFFFLNWRWLSLFQRHCQVSKTAKLNAFILNKRTKAMLTTFQTLKVHSSSGVYKGSNRANISVSQLLFNNLTTAWDQKLSGRPEPISSQTRGQTFSWLIETTKIEAHFQMPCLRHRWIKEQQHQYTNDKRAHYLDHQSHGQLTSMDVFLKSTAHTNRDTSPSPPNTTGGTPTTKPALWELVTGPRQKKRKRKSGTLQLAAILSDWIIHILLNVSVPPIYYNYCTVGVTSMAHTASGPSKDVMISSSC